MFDYILKEIDECLSLTTKEHIEQIVELIKSKERIITIGAGRMGYSLKAFSMRLSHLGYNSFHIGDTNLPRIDKNDLIIIGSGSGETKTIVEYAKIAKSVNCSIVLVTHEPLSSIGIISNLIIPIKKIKTRQIMKSVYEQSTYILYDFICSSLVNTFSLDIKWIESNHSILE